MSDFTEGLPQGSFLVESSLTYSSLVLYVLRNGSGFTAGKLVGEDRFLYGTLPHLVDCINTDAHLLGSGDIQPGIQYYTLT